jgi:hypothetical protein
VPKSGPSDGIMALFRGTVPEYYLHLRDSLFTRAESIKTHQSPSPGLTVIRQDTLEHSNRFVKQVNFDIANEELSKEYVLKTKGILSSVGHYLPLYKPNREIPINGADR